MDAQHYFAPGGSGDAIVWLPNQPTRTRRLARWGYKWKGWCKLSLAHDAAGGLIPANGTTMDKAPTSSTLANASSFSLSDVDVSDGQVPDIVEVTLTYNLYGDQQTEHQAGDIEQRCEVITIPFSLDDTALGSSFASEVATAKASGKKVLDLPGLKYSYSAYLASFPWTEAALIAASGIGLGKLGAPTGITSPTANRWMFRGKEISTSKKLTRASENWEYSPVDWPH